MTMTTTPSSATAPANALRTAPPRHNPPARLAVAKPEAENGAMRFLIYLRLHWLTIVFCGALLGCVMAYAAWSLMPPKYESYALFQVASAPQSVSGTNEPAKGKTEFATYMKTTASLFKSEFVYVAALRDPEFRLTDLATIQAEKDPFKYFEEKLQVDPKDGSEIIRMSIQGDNPDDVKRIVGAISAAYLKEVIQKEIEAKTAWHAQLKVFKATLEQSMKGNTALRPDPITNVVPGGVPMVMPKDPAKAPDPVTAQASPVPETDQMKREMFKTLITQIANLRTQFPKYDLQIDENKAMLKAAKDDLQLLLSSSVSADTIEIAKKDPDYLKAQAEAKQARRNYSQRFDVVNDKNSDGIKALARAAENAEINAKQILDTKAKAFEIEKRKPDFARLNEAINIFTNNITRLTLQKNSDQKQLAIAIKDASDTPFPASELKGTAKEPSNLMEASVVDYHSLETLYSRVAAQLIAAEFDLKTPKRVAVIQNASTPSQKDPKKQIIGTVFAGLMGFVLVGAFVVAYESRARKVSSLGEMKSTCTTPVVSVIPWLPTAATARDPIKRSDVNEAIDKLRAYFAQTWLNRGATTVTVTSALGDEGKSFTAFGLASSLAQAGYKTLLVDFDLREPSLHNYAGVPNTLGVCELLRGEADFRKTIQALPNGLNFLSAGKWSDEARQAAVGGRLDALLLRLKEPFDCIVLHGHALLTAAESVEVARRSEVVLLCAQYRESRVPLIKRAAERIATMEVPYSGIVYVGASTQEALC
jgi:polysaccharide biosynthesis transport protein